uniref:Uncharacterized protein n=1 Tax=Sphaerodactylus townsendi TaxID=933632 RepID=A0ACB8EKH4_9SAUR
MDPYFCMPISYIYTNGKELGMAIANYQWPRSITFVTSFSLSLSDCTLSRAVKNILSFQSRDINAGILTTLCMLTSPSGLLIFKCFGYLDQLSPMILLNPSWADVPVCNFLP